MLSAATLALLFCLNSSGTTYFDGGSADALTTALARATHGTVMIETASAIVLPAMALNTESTDTLGPSFLKGPLWLAAGTDYVLSDGAYVRSHFGTLLDGPAAVKTDSVPQSALKNGLFSFQTDHHRPISVASIAKLSWSRPFLVHYLLRDLALSISAVNLPEENFLNLLAKALGGNWIYENGVRVLVPNRAQLRDRLVNTFSLTKAPADRLKATRRLLYLAAVEGLDNDALETLFNRAEGNSEEIIVRDSDVSKAAVAYIEAAADHEMRNDSFRPRTASFILSQADNNRTARIRLFSNGNFELMVPTINSTTGRPMITTLD